jgi:hypothetical protein
VEAAAVPGPVATGGVVPGAVAGSDGVAVGCAAATVVAGVGSDDAGVLDAVTGAAVDAGAAGACAVPPELTTGGGSQQVRPYQ